METAFWCIAEKDGEAVAWGSLAVGLLILTVGLFILAFSFALGKAVLRGEGNDWMMAAAVAEKLNISGKGPGAVVVIAIVGLALILSTVYVGYLWTNDFLGRYSISFNTFEVSETLQEVKRRYQSTTDVTIELSPDCEGFAIKGEFAGACATDLLDTICRQYNNEMSCSRTDEVFEISQCVAR